MIGDLCELADAQRSRSGGRVLMRPRRRQLPQGPSVWAKMAPREGGLALDVLGLQSTMNNMFTSKPDNCTGRTLVTQERLLRYLRHLGNSQEESL